ncbi:MAG: Pectinesterase [Chlorobi bacterium OLB7]|nr:MAG: Pectinesterase [Chlorobi bacterium OLB7]
MRIVRNMQLLGASALALLALSGTARAQQWDGQATLEDPVWRGGKVGIGKYPIAKLDVLGDLAMNDFPLKLRGSMDASHYLKFSQARFGLVDVDFWSYSNYIVMVQGENMPRFTFTGAGSLGIGTTDPTQRLTLANGNLLLPSGSGSTDGNLYFGGTPEFGQNGMRIFGGLVDGITQAGFIDVKTTVQNDGLRFRVNTTNGTTERMRITAQGRIGIANTDPKEILQIGDRWTFQDNAAYKAMSYNVYTDLVDKRIMQDEAASIGMTRDGDVFLRTAQLLGTGKPITWINGVYVKNSGKVGINTTAPSSQLDVYAAAGTGTAGNFWSSTRGVNGIADGASTNGMKVGVWGSATGTGLGQVYGVYGTTVGSNAQADYAAVYANGNLKYTGTLSSVSDARLKENVEPLTGMLDKVAQLAPKSYTFKTDIAGMNLPTGTQVGFIAQEVEKVFPELVTTNFVPGADEENSTEYKGINYIGLVPVMAEAIREQRDVVTANHEEVTDLKKDVSDVKTNVSNLTTQVGALATEDANIKKQIETLSSENSTLKNDVADLKAENNDLKQQMATALAELKNLRHSVDSLLNVGRISDAPGTPISNSVASLGQNTPNPFSDETTISYALPTTTKAGELVIADVNGKELQRIPLADRGNAKVTISVKGMRAGTYVYSLVADGNIVGSEKMVVVK